MAEFLGHIGIHVYNSVHLALIFVGFLFFNSTLLERKRPAEKLNAMHRYMTSELFPFFFICFIFPCNTLNFVLFCFCFRVQWMIMNLWGLIQQ